MKQIFKSVWTLIDCRLWNPFLIFSFDAFWARKKGDNDASPLIVSLFTFDKSDGCFKKKYWSLQSGSDPSCVALLSAVAVASFSKYIL